MNTELCLEEKPVIRKNQGLSEGEQKEHKATLEQGQGLGWHWHKCHFVLREITDGEIIFRSLKPTVELVSLKTVDEPVKISLKVQMDRAFEYNKETEWTWHKSWIIPTIHVSVSMFKSYKGKPILPENSYFQIRVVKASSKNPDKLYLIDMGIEGQSTVSASEGVGIFQGLKFVETSYKNQGTKFNLVISLKYTKPGNCHPQNLSCIISPPVFIDSRRTARNSHLKTHIQKPKINIQQFNPFRFAQVLVKRLKQSQVLIDNSVQGFFNYLTSPNIRNKIKNPFFFCVRFSKALDLYYNQKHITKEENLIKTFMKRSKQMIYEDKIKSKKERKNNEGITSNTLIALVIKGEGEIVKEILTKLQSNSILSILGNQLPEQTLKQGQEFVHINSDKLKTIYEQYYKNGEEDDSQEQLNKESFDQSEQLVFRPIAYRPPPPSDLKFLENSFQASYQLISLLPYRHKQVQIITNSNVKLEENVVVEEKKKNKKTYS